MDQSVKIYPRGGDPRNRFVTDRPAVILLHASASTPKQWDALVERLRPRFRPLAYALQGRDDAALVTETLTRLGGGYLVGHSYGGAVAMMVASQRHGLVRGLALYEPVVFRALLSDPASGREAQHVLTIAEAIRYFLGRNEPEAAAQRFFEYWSGADAWRYLPPSRQAAISARMAEVLGNFDALFETPFDAPAFSRLRRPALFLSGEQTVASTKRLAVLLRDAFPMATHEVLPGMGHMGPVTHPEPVNERIEQFLLACETGATQPITQLKRSRT